jgi:urease accessory protein
MSAAYLSLLLADGRLPTGAHTQSGGAEPAFQRGMKLSDVPEYLAVRLETVTEVEAATAVVARHVWREAESAVSVAALKEVDRAWRVRTASDALRDASDLLARSYLRLAAAVWPLDALTTRRGPWCRPVVIGATAAATGLDAGQTARLVAYDEIQTVVAAALKLRPFDPAVGVAWVAAAAPAAEALVARVAGLTSVDHIPAPAAPQLEEWAQLHRNSERRLFRA